MNEILPKVAAKSSFKIDVKAGQKYFWCSCGLSAKQPFCDSAHKGSGLKSVMFEATKDETLYFCGCKQTKHAPFCDSSHKGIA